MEELLTSPLRITGALTCDLIDRTPRGTALVAALRDKGVQISSVPEKEYLTACDTNQPQGILAVAAQPNHTLETVGKHGPRRLLVLDGVQDPGNVGALLRTAYALGADATVALPGTVDFWNAKVVRGAVGMHFRHPTVTCPVSDFGAFLTAYGIVLWGADVDGVPVGQTPVPDRLAILMGNEGGGVSSGARELCESMVSLPMVPGAESLNVAVAAGILLYTLRQ